MDIEKMFNFCFEVLKSHGPFTGGIVFGCMLSMFFNNQVSKERIKRQEIDLKREKNLLDELELKNKRIDKLHDEIGKLHDEIGKIKNKREK